MKYLLKVNQKAPTMYQLLNKAVNIKDIADYFSYKKDINGYITVMFENQKFKIMLNDKYNNYYFALTGKEGSDFADLFRRGSKEKFNTSYTILEARKRIKDLLIKGKIKNENEIAVSMLENGFYRQEDKKRLNKLY